MLAGLSRARKEIPPRFFYDEAGSKLFDEICELPEYYPPRVEIGILTSRLPELAARVVPGASVIGFGSARARKVRLLLDALREPAGYAAIDISREELLSSCRALAQDEPRIRVVAMWADYMEPLDVSVLAPLPDPRIVFFPGSTIGNLHPEEALAFLKRIARVAGPGGRLVLGADLVKDPAVLHAAYNDARGVTAAFNRNVLARANRELSAEFDLGEFEHRAFYDAGRARIEMHLVSRRAQSVVVAGRTFAFAEGETILTECSYKYTVDGMRDFARLAGFLPCDVWVDERRWFSVHDLVVAASR